MLLTRRDFFRNLKDNLVENLHDSLPVMGKKNLLSENINPAKWIFLGTISEFPPGLSYPVNDGNHFLVSVPEGFYVLDKNTNNTDKKEPRLLIRLENARNIMMKTIEICPAGTVLSVLTGELTDEEEEI